MAKQHFLAGVGLGRALLFKGNDLIGVVTYSHAH